MNIPLHKLDYTFQKKPLLVGGKAMEYYGLRQAGADIDFIADPQDVYALIRQYPQRVKDLWSDLGVCPYEFEIWKTICLFGYDDLREHAAEEEQYLVISLENLLVLKSFATAIEKYRADVQLIVAALRERRNSTFLRVRDENAAFLASVAGVTIFEKSGPA